MSGVKPDLMGSTAERVEQLFTQAGAYRSGHFKLKSGRHSDRYLEKFAVLQWPAAVTELCAMFAAQAWAMATAGGTSPDEQVDVVLGPTTGGVILAFETARQLGVRGIFAETVTDTAGADLGSRRELRRGFEIAHGERVLLVDDVLTTGASLAEMLPVVERAGGVLVGTLVLVDRTGGLAEVKSSGSAQSYPVTALWSLSLPTYEPGEECPGCRAGLALEAPGSSGAAAGG